MSEEDDQLTESITYRVSKRDVERLKAVSGPVSKSLVARAAMRLGLKAFEKDPTKVMKLKPAPTGPRPKKATRKKKRR